MAAANKPPLPEHVRLQLLPPADAVRAFQARGLLAPTFSWQDMWQAEHAGAFTVAGLMRLDLLKAVHDGLAAAIGEGLTLREFQRRLQPLLEREGWWGKKPVADPDSGEIRLAQLGSPERLELIYDVNLRQSYAAGKWARAQRAKRRLPYLVYRTMRDERVRASHAAWDGLALPVDAPFWRSHYPPNGWRCRCTVFQTDEAGLSQLAKGGVKVKREAPPIETREFVNRRTGEILRVPTGIDPGWGYNPGAASLARQGRLLLDKAIDAPPRVAAVAVAEALADARLRAELADDFAAWAGAIGQPRGELRQVGALPLATLDRLARDYGLPESALISVRDSDVLHTHRDAKQDRLPWVWYLRLPEHLARPAAVLLERGSTPPVLLLVFDTPAGTGKLVLRVDYRMPVRGGQVRTNILGTGKIMNRQALADPGAYELVQGGI